MTQFQGIEMLIQAGDTITSKKGILMKDPLVEGGGMIVHCLKNEGFDNGFVHWRVIENKRYPREFVEMENVKP